METTNKIDNSQAHSRLGTEGRRATPVNVTFFHRKPRPSANHSLEFIFQDVRERLTGLICSRKATCPFVSSGLFRRLANSVFALWQQGDVNHVTGDVNYVGIFLRKRRTIQTFLDCGHLDRTRGIRHWLLALFWVWLPARRCAQITVISEATKQELIRYSACDPDKISVIPVAIADHFQRYDRAFNRERPRILQVGTAPNKNIPRLAEALRGLPCILDIIGDLSPENQRVLAHFGIAYSCASNLSDLDVVRKYEEADLVSFVSTYEGFGMPILEGQAVGRPVVTSNLLSMPAVAGGAACLVDPFDVADIRRGIVRVIEDEVYRAGLIRDGFQNIRRFNPSAIAMQYHELYLKVASGRRGRLAR